MRHICFFKTFHRGLPKSNSDVCLFQTTRQQLVPIVFNLTWKAFPGLFVDWKIVPVHSSTCQFDQKALDTLLTRLDLLFFHFMSDKRLTGKNNFPSIFRIVKQHQPRSLRWFISIKSSMWISYSRVKCFILSVLVWYSAMKIVCTD